MLQDHRTSLKPCSRSHGCRVRSRAEQTRAEHAWEGRGEGGQAGNMEPGGSEPKDSAGKPHEAKARATPGPLETESLLSPWQAKSDTWPRCLMAVAICKSIQQRNGPGLERWNNVKK